MGLVIVSLDKITIEKSLRLGFSAMNNEAEYEALLTGIAKVQKMGGKAIKVFSDSRLIIGQVKGELEARYLRMQGYLSQARRLQSGFEFFTIQQISRIRNTHTNSWQLWQPLLDKIYLGSNLLRIYIGPLRRRRRKSNFTKSRSNLVGWIP